jgi:hypothetical protein
MPFARQQQASIDAIIHLRDVHQERLGDSSFPNFMNSGSDQRLNARYSRARFDSKQGRSGNRAALQNRPCLICHFPA